MSANNINLFKMMEDFKNLDISLDVEKLDASGLPVIKELPNIKFPHPSEVESYIVIDSMPNLGD